MLSFVCHTDLVDKEKHVAVWMTSLGHIRAAFMQSDSGTRREAAFHTGTPCAEK